MNVAQTRQLPARNDLPKFIEDQQAQAQKPRAVVTFPDEVPAVPFATRMADLVWPAALWALFLYNSAVMTLAVYTIAVEGFSAWVHAQAGLIVVMSTGLAAIIVKWIINGPDGMPHQQRQSKQPDDLDD